MWLIISALCIPVTILEMFSRTQFFTKTGGCRIFFSRPVAGLTNRGHVRDFRAGAPLTTSRFGRIKDIPCKRLCDADSSPRQLRIPLRTTTLNLKGRIWHVSSSISDYHRPVLSLFNLYVALSSSSGRASSMLLRDFDDRIPQLVMCRLRPEARSRAKPGQKKPGQAEPFTWPEAAFGPAGDF